MEDSVGTEIAVINVEDRSVEVKEAFGDAVDRLHELTINVETEEQRDQIIRIGTDLKTKLNQVKGLRDKYYDPVYRKAELLRAVYDKPYKMAEKVIKAAQAAVTKYNTRKRREAEIAREQAEADARKAREEAERKQREAEEAERRAIAEAEARKNAEEEEKRRVEQARIDAERKKLDEERAEMEREKAELKRKREQEEKDRLAHALEAERVGNLDKVDKTLEKEKPLPVDATPVVKGPTDEELAERERQDKEEVERVQKAEKDATEARARVVAEKEAADKARREADEATAKAKEAELAASAVVDVLPTGTTSYTYAVEGPKKYLEFLEGVVSSAKRDFEREESREKNSLEDDSVLFVPRALEYAGFDIKKPEKFETVPLNRDVKRLKSKFHFPGIRVWEVVEDKFKANKTEVEQVEEF